MLFTRYAVGTDTRPQFTTPPDPRIVDDLGDCMVLMAAGGTVAGTFNHTSAGSWLRVDWGSGDKVNDDGNWNGTYDCWVPPSSFFDNFTTLYVDIPFVTSFYDVSNRVFTCATQAATRSSLGAGSVLAEYNGLFHRSGDLDGTFGYACTFSGCIPAVPLTTGQTVELRTFQSDSSSSNRTVAYRWGVRVMGGA